jgi:hypothetical protein
VAASSERVTEVSGADWAVMKASQTEYWTPEPSVQLVCLVCVISGLHSKKIM